MQIEKRRLKKPSLFDFLHESAGGRAAPLALHGAKGEILSRENGPLFRTGAKGERRARRGTKGGILFSKRIPPLNPPEKDEGRPPSTPDIAGLGLEELLSLRNRVRCTWLRHESLRFVTTRNRALLP